LGVGLAAGEVCAQDVAAIPMRFAAVCGMGDIAGVLAQLK
jgi:hypothetical protein